ncbi:type III secretion protein [Pseudomonas orientalis]|uniref:type III secretion protein n=1 Tax=Pseudomonas orientalis TaxID=76758 RepID=UPI002FE2223F
MKDLIIHWLKSGEEQITLIEGQDEIVVSLQGSGVLVCAKLTSTSPHNTELQCWVRLGAASLTHFQGALARASSSGDLWITQSLQGAPQADRVLDSVESLLNQRDTWRAVYARLNKQAHQLKPTSLRSLRH